MSKTNIEVPEKIPMDMSMDPNHLAIYTRMNRIIDCLSEVEMRLRKLWNMSQMGFAQGLSDAFKEEEKDK